MVISSMDLIRRDNELGEFYGIEVFSGFYVGEAGEMAQGHGV